MTTTTTRKLTIIVSEDFKHDLKRTVGLRHAGRFIKKHLSLVVATNSNLETGCKAMSQDKGIETEAREWCEN